MPGSFPGTRNLALPSPEVPSPHLHKPQKGTEKKGGEWEWGEAEVGGQDGKGEGRPQRREARNVGGGRGHSACSHVLSAYLGRGVGCLEFPGRRGNPEVVGPEVFVLLGVHLLNLF